MPRRNFTAGPMGPWRDSLTPFLSGVGQVHTGTRIDSGHCGHTPLAGRAVRKPLLSWSLGSEGVP